MSDNSPPTLYDVPVPKFWFWLKVEKEPDLGLGEPAKPLRRHWFEAYNLVQAEDVVPQEEVHLKRGERFAGDIKGPFADKGVESLS
jgi:hypothetical protein